MRLQPFLVASQSVGLYGLLKIVGAVVLYLYPLSTGLKSLYEIEVQNSVTLCFL